VAGSSPFTLTTSLVTPSTHTVPVRVPELPIRDCAGSFNSCVPRRSKVSAMDVTAKTIFESLYLVLGLAPICALSQLSECSHTPPTPGQLFLDFCAIFFPAWPLIFCQHDSPSNLADSRYPHPGTIPWREQKSVQNRFVPKLFRTSTTVPSQGTVNRIGYP